MLTLIDEYTREYLAIRVARRLGRYEVIEPLADASKGFPWFYIIEARRSPVCIPSFVSALASRRARR